MTDGLARTGNSGCRTCWSTIDASKYAIKTTELLVSKVTLILNDQDGLKTRVSLAPREGFLVPVESDRKKQEGGDSNGGIDALVEDYYRRHPEKTPRGKSKMIPAMNRLLMPLMRRVRPDACACRC
ncbi:bacteriophage Mu P protein [Escherichia coli]|nr:hypothetical protein [Escherichia coli]SQB84700.1 bacteriophage Mu P protein [Escherichia coli]